MKINTPEGQALIDLMHSVKKSIEQDLLVKNELLITKQIKEEFKEFKGEITSLRDDIKKDIKEIKNEMKETITPVSKVAYASAEDVRFLKRFIFIIAGFVSFIGLDKLANVMRSLFS